ncbi:MAG TPA: SDR family oxidoreductase [Azospirillaceae bacterium]|nr:SDR family oxidoreductase [Azospirillaceae bacterium]
MARTASRPRFKDKVVVLTGASSGIGRAAALAFAREGARLALAARSEDALEDTARLCRLMGAETVALPTDVTVPMDVAALRDAALNRWGRIDVWINNAGIGALGWFEEVPAEAHRRVVETNLVGPLNGAAVVMPHFVRRRRGVLINMVSVGGWVAPPLAAAYTAAKFGLRGLTEALYQDYRRFPGIHVCGLYPSFVDTPGLVNKGNYTGKALVPRSPMQTPEHVAARMLDLAEKPRRSMTVGWSARLGEAAYAHAPELVGALLFRFVQASLAKGQPAETTSGNLFEGRAWPPRKSAGNNTGGALLPLAMAALGLGVLAAAGSGRLKLPALRREDRAEEPQAKRRRMEPAWSE